MDVQVFLHLFQWILLLCIPLISGFPHNLLVSRLETPNSQKASLNYKATSNTQVPHFFHKNAVNSSRIPYVYKQTGDQNGGANSENLEKHIKHAGIVKNVNSVGQTKYQWNTPETDSYLRYLPWNLQKYILHSKQKETQKLGIGSVFDAKSSKHLSHLSSSQAIRSIGTYSDAYATAPNRKQHKLRNRLKEAPTELSKLYSKGTEKEKLLENSRQTKNSKAHLQKRHVIGTKPKDSIINFAVLSEDNVTSDQSEHSVVNMILSVGAGLVILGMGIVLGIFGCCCKKKKVDSKKDKDEHNAIINTAEEIDKSLPDAKLDLSESSKEDEEPKSIKDKIKAFENDNKIITPPPSTNVTPHGKIRNSEAFTALEGKQLFMGMTKPPKVIVEDNRSKDEGLGDTSGSRTEDLSKSDTHEEVSEIALDNVSTHSSISQPHNPDVVIASDDEDEFAEIQRGTVILKSFQRAKPPRNRSPATRSNRKLKKSPGHRDSPDVSGGMDSLSPLMSQSLYVESASEKLEDTRDKSGSVPDNLDILVEPVNISKSMKNTNDEIQKQSKSKGGSSQDADKGKDIPNGARYKKNKDSPMTKPKYRKKEKESSADSDSNKRISLSELESKQKGLASEKDSKNKTEEKVAPQSDETTEISESDKNVKRLSGLPPNVNNIFYLIDPTVKDKCRSAGDVSASNGHNNGKSKDPAHKKNKASKHKQGKDSKEADEVIPKKRERTFSDPQRHSKEVENTAL